MQLKFSLVFNALNIHVSLHPIINTTFFLTCIFFQVRVLREKVTEIFK